MVYSFFKGWVVPCRGNISEQKCIFLLFFAIFHSKSLYFTILDYISLYLMNICQNPKVFIRASNSSYLLSYGHFCMRFGPFLSPAPNARFLYPNPRSQMPDPSWGSLGTTRKWSGSGPEVVRKWSPKLTFRDSGN